MTENTCREDVTFLSEGESVAAWFYQPQARTERQPCIILGHGFAGVKEARLDAFAERFADAGFACLVFDYRHLGASSGQPRQLIDLNRHRADWRAAIAYARGRSDVDPARIALWGTSLGGGLVLELAARRRDIRCVVLQSPLVDTFATRSEAPNHARRVAFATVRDLLGALLRRQPYVIPVVGPYDSLAFMTEPEAEPGYLSIVRNAPAWRNQVTARTALQLALFRPARRARDVQCPLLVVTGDSDQITPAAVTRRKLASTAATYFSYAGGHFDGYLGLQFARCADAAVAFFKRTLQPEAVTEQNSPPAA
jgi:dienelactone hydrolase